MATPDNKPGNGDIKIYKDNRNSANLIHFLDPETEEPFKPTDLVTTPLERQQSLKRSSVKRPRAINTSAVVSKSFFFVMWCHFGMPGVFL